MSFPFEPEGIPDALKEREQWLVVKGDKVPRTPDGQPASWNDPNTWLSFEEALEYVESGEFDGLEFIVSEGDPFVFIDIDDAVTERFGGGLKPWLPDLECFDGTFIEYSQSGTGMHVFVEGDLPAWWRDADAGNHEGVEAADKKPVLVTGKAIAIHSAPKIKAIDPAPFLGEAYEAIVGEPPTAFTGAEDRPPSSAPEVDIYDVISRARYPRGANRAHPFHGSTTGQNFRVDDDAETFRCWRHSCTGNALHLLGMDLGLIECGDWVHGGLEAETWRDIFDAAREAGYDIPKPESKALPNGGTDVASSDTPTDTGGRLDPAVAHLEDPEDIINVLGEDPEEVTFNDLTINQIVNAVADIIAASDRYHFLVVDDDTEAIYAYDHDRGIWRRDGERRLKGLARRVFSYQNSRRVYGELTHAVRSLDRKAPGPDLWVDRDELGGEEGLLPLENGVLDLTQARTGDVDVDLRDPRPEDLFLSRLPTTYDPDASVDGTRFQRYVIEAVPDEEERATLQEYAGYCLWVGGQPFKKALFILGPTDSGKSTFLDAIELVLGEENVAWQSLYNLIQTRWGTSKIYGSVVNMANEVSAGSLKRVERFKELTGGENTVTAEFKKQPTFEFVATQKFIFATNRFPRMRNADEAFFNRCLFVEFPNTVADEDKEDLLEQFEDETSAILNWMLEGLDRLREQGGAFTGERPLDDKRGLTKSFGTPTEQFAYEYLELTNDPKDVVHKRGLKDAFSRFCDYDDAIEDTPGGGVFTRRLKQLPGVGEGQSRRLGDPEKEDDRPRVYTGVRIDVSGLRQIQAEVPSYATADDEISHGGDDEWPDDEREADDDEATVDTSDDRDGEDASGRDGTIGEFNT